MFCTNRNLRDKGIETFKVGIPQMSAYPGATRIASAVPELRSARRWNVVLCWNFAFSPAFCDTVSYNCCYLKEE